jgi:hypothetical protein
VADHAVTALSLIPLSAMDASMEWDSNYQSFWDDFQVFKANAQERAALSSASQIKPTSLSCPSGLQSTFAGDA